MPGSFDEGCLCLQTCDLDGKPEAFGPLSGGGMDEHGGRIHDRIGKIGIRTPFGCSPKATPESDHEIPASRLSSPFLLGCELKPALKSGRTLKEG